MISSPPASSASPAPRSSARLERFAAPPSRRAGIVAALLAVVLFLVSALDIVLLDVNTEPIAAVRIFLGLNAVALLGFVPLLYAVHAITLRKARPPWLLLIAYLVLLIRPVVLAIEVATAPIAVFEGVTFFFALLGTTGIAAGLAAVALQPTVDGRGEPIGSTPRSIIIGVGVALVVALTLFAFAPYVAPVSAMGVAVGLSLRKPPPPPDPWEQRDENDGDSTDARPV